MMKTKYVMNDQGRFIMALELLGLDHRMLHNYFLTGTQVASAGFVSVNDEEGAFGVYGRSVSLDKVSKADDAEAMTQAFRDKSMVLMALTPEANKWVLTNDPIEGAITRPVDDLESLRAHRILWPE